MEINFYHPIQIIEVDRCDLDTTLAVIKHLYHYNYDTVVHGFRNSTVPSCTIQRYYQSSSFWKYTFYIFSMAFIDPNHEYEHLPQTDYDLIYLIYLHHFVQNILLLQSLYVHKVYHFNLFMRYVFVYSCHAFSLSPLSRLLKPTRVVRSLSIIVSMQAIIYLFVASP